MKRFTRVILCVAGVTAVLLGTVQADPPSGNTKNALPAASPLSTRFYPVIRTGETRFGWKWLAGQYDQDGNGIVIRKEFPASAENFVRLDRNWDGILTQDDFDWSGSGELGRQRETTFALFKAVDTASDGRITTDEWLALFDKAAKGKGYLTDEELERLIYVPRVLKSQKEQQNLASRMERQTEDHVPIGMAPALGEIAPDFELRSPDGRNTVRLSSFRGNKPVVLIFGSFT